MEPAHGSRPCHRVRGGPELPGIRRSDGTAVHQCRAARPGALMVAHLMSRMASRMAGIGPSIFTEMTRLAGAPGAVNLGQGFPDFPCPEFLKDAAAAAIRNDINQYAPSAGRPRLRDAIGAKVKRHYGIDVDPQAGILVTHGATEALFASILGLVDPGEEVIVFEPSYDSYVPAIQMAGGVPRYYSMHPPEWRVDPDELARLFTDRTRLILNTPHNPTGKVFGPEELGSIARLCCDHDVVAVTDEVYEHIIFDGARHRPLATLPGMCGTDGHDLESRENLQRDRMESGLGTGAAGVDRSGVPRTPVHRLRRCRPLTGGGRDGTAGFRRVLRRSGGLVPGERDYLLSALSSAGLTAIAPEGAYFVLVDITGLPFADDVAFCRYLTTEIGVACIPASAFYHNAVHGSNLVRFAFCKSQSTLEAASSRLSRLRALG